MKAKEEIKVIMANCPCEWYIGHEGFPSKSEDFIKFKGDIGVMILNEWRGWGAESGWVVEIHCNSCDPAKNVKKFAIEVAKVVGAEKVTVIQDDSAYRIDRNAYSRGLAYAVSPFEGGNKGWELRGPEQYDIKV